MRGHDEEEMAAYERHFDHGELMQVRMWVCDFGGRGSKATPYASRLCLAFGTPAVAYANGTTRCKHLGIHHKPLQLLGSRRTKVAAEWTGKLGTPMKKANGIL